MNVTEPTQVGGGSASTAPVEHERCDECGAPVDREQRYCVSCGSHRRHVDDPAARYLSAATARARRSPVAETRPPATARRGSGLVLAVLLALIPVGVAIGVVVGRSSNNDDAKLIQALGHRQTQTVVASSAPTTSTTSTVAHHGTSAASHSKAAARHHATSHPSKKHHASHTTTSATSPRSYAGKAKAPSDVNSKPTTAQQQQGKKIVTKLQHTNGTGYLNQLPPKVVVP